MHNHKVGRFRYLDAVELRLEVVGDPPRNISIVGGNSGLPQGKDVGVEGPLRFSRGENGIDILLVLVSLQSGG